MKWEKTITTEQEYEKSLARLSKIFEADADSDVGVEAELLVTLIDKYEKEHYPISLPDPIDAIKETMERKGFKDKDLISAIGSKTTVSLVLNRKRALTIDMIRNLSDLLGLPLEVLIQPYELGGKQKKVTNG
jgi:HTH-type transcriptional regulator / antitoxin HigA